jgi:hypothetical protein
MAFMYDAPGVVVDSNSNNNGGWSSYRVPVPPPTPAAATTTAGIATHPHGLTVAGKVITGGVLIVALWAFGCLIALWSNDYGALKWYFAFVFTVESIAMIIPVRPRLEDLEQTYCFRKSWPFFFNGAIQLTTIMFLVFVAVAIVLLGVVQPVGTDPYKTIPIAVTTGLIVALVLMAWQGIAGSTFLISFWLLFTVLLFLNIPLPYDWMKIFGGFATMFAVTAALQCCLRCTTHVQELHEHLAVGLALIWSIYSLFGDWQVWYTKSYKEYTPLFVMGMGAGVARLLYRWVLIRLLRHYDHLTDAKEVQLTAGSLDGDDDDSDPDAEDTAMLPKRGQPKKGYGVSGLRSHVNALSVPRPRPPTPRPTRTKPPAQPQDVEAIMPAMVHLE